MENKENIKWGERLSFGSGQGGSVILSALFSTFLLAYYTDTVLIGAAAIATMFLITRFFDGITDFIVGAFIDKTNTRFGKARPWIMAASITMLIGIALMFRISPDWSDKGKLIYAYATYMFANCVAYTIFTIAHGALLARISTSVKERTLLSSVSMIINNVINMIVGSIATPMVLKLGWQNTSLILAVVAGVLIFIEFLGTKERVAVETGEAVKDTTPLSEQIKVVFKNRYFWNVMIINILILMMNANSIQSMIYYCNNILHNPMFISVLVGVAGIPSIFFMFIVPKLSAKFSKRGVLLGSAVLLIISFLIMGFAGSNQTWILVGVVLKNIAVSPMFALPMALVADIVDYNDYKTGMRCDGLINTSGSIGVKIGIGFGAAMTGWILAFFGYEGGAAVQTERALTGITFSFSWVGVVLSVLIFAAILFMDIEKKLPEVHEGLEARKNSK